jgi:hypothetical protein
LIDWQNVLFLLFMPLMLAVASAIFRATYKAMGAPSQAAASALMLPASDRAC